MVGIYRIINIVSGKSYVGSSVSISNRITGHFSLLRKGRSHSPKLQSAFNKHGLHAFTFEVLEACSKEDLSVKEKHWIDAFDSVNNGYNCSNDTICATRGMRHSEESRRKMSESQKKAQTPERKIISTQNIVQYNRSQKGKPKSESHKARISLSNFNIEKARLRMYKSLSPHGNIGHVMPSHVKELLLMINTGRKMSDDCRKKISNSKKGKCGVLANRKVALIQYDLKGNLLNTFCSASEASRDLGIQRTGIKNNLRGYSKTCSGFIFKYQKDVPHIENQ